MDKVIVEYNSPCGILFQHRILNRDYTVKFSSHAQYEFVFLIKGKMELTIDGAHFDVSSGEMILIDVKMLHSQRMFEGVDTELMVVTFAPEILPFFVKLGCVKVSADNPLLKYRISANIASKYKLLSFFKKINCYAVKENLPYKESLICAEIIKLITAVNTAIDKVTYKKDNTNTGQNKGFVFEDCVNFINSNITRMLTIDEIAKNSFISKSYLQHLFKKRTGMYITDYINKQKMTIAHSLLSSNYKPSEVADKLGYEYYSTFSSKFKKFYGVSPKDIPVTKLIKNKNLEENIKEE